MIFVYLDLFEERSILENFHLCVGFSMDLQNIKVFIFLFCDNCQLIFVVLSSSFFSLFLLFSVET